MTEVAKTELEVATEAAENAAKEVNAAREGKGTRQVVRLTRGRNPVPVTFEQFDESLPETLPVDMDEFMSITKVTLESAIMKFVIDGYNVSQWESASDPIAEYVDATWDDDVQKGFRLSVRNYAANAEVSIEEAVALIRPGIAKKAAKDAAAKKALAEAEAAKKASETPAEG